MIVRQVRERFQLITQPDHARLAGRIMEHCILLRGHPRRGEVLHAITEHDNGWAIEDAAPTVHPDGTIVDFMNAPAGMRHAVWPRSVANLADHPWPAALVAQHALTIYDRFRPEAEWVPFFAGMESTRDRLVQECGRSGQELEADYRFIRLADLISLAFCTGWTDEQRVSEWRIRPGDPRVLVTPDIFGGQLIPFAIEAREIRSNVFRSDTALRDALREANTVTLRGEVSGE